MLIQTQLKFAAASLLVFALMGCASESSKVAQREDLLAASGFTIKPADNPKRQAMLAKLPAHHFVQRAKNGKAIFLYADPSVCACLYIGDDKAYSRYQETVLQRQMARDEGDDQAQLIRESRSDYNADLKTTEIEDEGWDWGPWGPGWW